MRTYKDKIRDEIEAHENTIVMLSRRIAFLKQQSELIGHVPDKRITDMGLSLRTMHALRYQGMLYASQVLIFVMSHGWTGLTKLKRMGKVNTEELIEAMLQQGFERFVPVAHIPDIPPEHPLQDIPYMFMTDKEKKEWKEHIKKR